MNLCIPSVSDSALFGERVGSRNVTPVTARKVRCCRCGTPERKRRSGSAITTNISHILGLCGGCVAKEANV